MSRQRVLATGEAISTAKAQERSADAKLLRLEAEFNAASDREESAADRVDELDAEYDRLRKRMFSCAVISLTIIVRCSYSLALLSLIEHLATCDGV